MKLKNYCAAAAITLAAAASSQAATVFTDDFNYTVINAFVAEGGWTGWSDTGGSDPGSGIFWGNGSWLEYNDSAFTLEDGDVITMDAHVDNVGQRANDGYLYGMEIMLWDGVDTGTMTAALGTSGVQQGNLNSDAGVGTLNQVSYTVTASDIANGLDNVAVKYSNDTNWGQTFDVTVGVTEVPEPSSAALLGLGGLALILRRRK